MTEFPQSSDQLPHERVAEEARALLARRRLSGAKAAQILGWSAFYMSRRLTGRTPFDVNDLSALADLLDVEITDFFPKPKALSGESNNRCSSTVLTLTACDLSQSATGRFSALAA